MAVVPLYLIVPVTDAPPLLKVNVAAPMVVESSVSLNTTVMMLPMGTFVALLAGIVELTVGAVVSEGVGVGEGVGVVVVTSRLIPLTCTGVVLFVVVPSPN